MSYKIITPMAAEPITLVEARLHCRIDTISGVHPDDTLLEALITAAREFAEHYTGKAMATQTLEMALPCFPDCDGEILLDMPPVASISHIKYTDLAGAEQTLSADDYSLSTYGNARAVALTYGNYWPSTQAIPDAVRIRYVTGYASLPRAARAAMLLLVGHLYENRQEGTRVKVEQLPLGICHLLGTVKLWAL